MDADFYRSIAPTTRFVELADPDTYHRVPSTWHVVVADVLGSTKAIEAGRYKEVNMVGAASIVAVLNALGTHDLPFVFGGDGATLLLDESQREAATRALGRLAAASRAWFGLELRVGVVPVAHLEREGCELKVAKLALSDRKSMAMFWGQGFLVAERWVKSETKGPEYAVAEENADPPLAGLSCRWNPIQSRRGTMLTLIALARSSEPQVVANVYRRLLDRLDAIVAESKPIAESTAEMGNDPNAFALEATLRACRRSGLRHFYHRCIIALESAIARFSIRRRLKVAHFDGPTYKNVLLQHTDFRKFDGAVRMVLDVTAQQARDVRALLDEAYLEGELVYGVHESSHALMTCLVYDYDHDHVHFIDGSDGGYALAAKAMKSQRLDATMNAPPSRPAV